MPMQSPLLRIEMFHTFSELFEHDFVVFWGWSKSELCIAILVNGGSCEASL